MKVSDAINALSALSQDSRLAVFRLLVKRGPDGYTPSTIAEKLGVVGPTLSFHLKELQNAGLLSSRREGRCLYYAVRFDRMKSLITFLTDECCSQSESGCDAECNPVSVPAKRRA